MSATATDITTILENAKPGPPRKCHNLDRRGGAVCGAFGPCPGSPNTHSEQECKARGHKKCLVCREIDRQLGDDGMVA
jgi:hypothetical protein